MPIDIEALVRAVGYPGLFLIVFAETGLLVGFFLPGDTLLLTAGFLASKDQLELALILPLLIAAAIIGDSVGYAIGKRTGPRLFRREESRVFRRSHLLRAEEFYRRHGGKTIVIARFVGFLRTFAPTVAGAANMSYPRFLAFNVFGGIGWVVTLTMAGYAVGGAVENLELYLGVIFGGAFVLSVAPGLWHVWRLRRRARPKRPGPVEQPLAEG
jgi:membrane-associated protein